MFHFLGTLLLITALGRPVIEPLPPVPVDQPNCIVGGCSGELCVDSAKPPIASTCIYREEYACFKLARCERQTNDTCDWTKTDEFLKCQNDPTLPPSTPISPISPITPITPTTKPSTCGNNICEPQEYIPCPTGAQCLWAGSCPQDCPQTDVTPITPLASPKLSSVGGIASPTSPTKPGRSWEPSGVGGSTCGNGLCDPGESNHSQCPPCTGDVCPMIACHFQIGTCPKDCPEEISVSPKPTSSIVPPTPSCFPRPTCLDTIPRCLLPEPVDGWCLTPITSTAAAQTLPITNPSPVPTRTSSRFFFQSQNFITQFISKIHFHLPQFNFIDWK